MDWVAVECIDEEKYQAVAAADGHHDINSQVESSIDPE